MRNDYQERQENRQERYEELADKATAEASRRANSVNVQTLCGMQGEPIKVGHHSERRHRRLIEKADADMRKSVEASRRAEHYASKAASVGCGGVSQDDPDAIAKLRDTLRERETRQELMKGINAAVRPLKLTIGDAWLEPARERLRARYGVVAGDGYLVELASAVKYEPPRFSLAFPSYALSNNSAEIRRLKLRIAKLEALPPADAPEELIAKGDNGEALTRPDLGRVAFDFNGKPSEETRDALKSRGFRWSRRELLWVRHLNANGVSAASELARSWGWELRG